LTSRRITIITAQLLGYDRSGGVGAATTFLTLGLAQMGHDVDVLYIGSTTTDAFDADWTEIYEQAGATVRRLPRSEQNIEPVYFARMRGVESALRADPPEVVIAHEYMAPTYTAQRLRQLGLAFESTLFVVFCHGTRTWVKEMNRNERVAPAVHALGRLEQATVELADVVVSPSAYLIGWMRQQGWSLPETARVIPLLTRSSVTDEPPPERVPVDHDRAVERLAFFGRLEERKGVEPFAAGLNALSEELLEGLELEFIGKPTKYWSTRRVEDMLSKAARRALRRVSFETELDQHEALTRLSRPGTLAVMPSLAENSPNVVYECLERGIPFLASNAGGIGELVAPEDRARVLFEPTAKGVAGALQRTLEAGQVPRPAQPAFDGPASKQAWADVVALRPQASAPPRQSPPVDVVVVEGTSTTALARCRSALAAQTYDELTVIVAPSRTAGLQAGRAPWVVFLDEEDIAAPELVETLVRAQVASGADVVTCGVLVEGTEYVFAGEPAGLGVLGNGYGTVALLRRELLGDVTDPWPVAWDPDWPMLARLSALGAQIVSVPASLVTRAVGPGMLDPNPSDGLLVVEQLERTLPVPLRGLARLAAGLAADAQRQSHRP
jgi:O-antigen biosynthesis protein